MRYPELSPDEIELLIRELPRLQTIDFILMSSNIHLAANLERFRKDQRHRLKSHNGRLLFVLLLFVVLVAGVGWVAVS